MVMKVGGGGRLSRTRDEMTFKLNMIQLKTLDVIEALWC